MQDNFIKILDLAEKMEADFMEEILKDNNIPFHIIPYEDSVFNHALPNSYQNWGRVETPEKYKDEVIQLYTDFKNSAIKEN